MHVANNVSEPRGAHTARRRDSTALRVETALENVEYSTASLKRTPSGDHHCDGRPTAFGLVDPFINSVANS